MRANACNGVEFCDPAAHRCAVGSPPGSGAACRGPGGSEGVCSAGDPPACVDAGCRNGVLEPGEECDDGNDVAGDGCEPDDCTFTCADDSRCDDHDPCNGREICSEEQHVCQPGAPPDCDDESDCTEDSCDRNGCQHVLIDADRDGFAPRMPGCGEDCDDSNPLAHPGATELCEAAPLVDNDCDGTTSDNPTSSTWYLDCDEDGYAAAGAPTSGSCTEPGLMSGCGWTARAPTDERTIDCDDTRLDVSPGQWMYFTMPLAGGTDDAARFGNYDCDGAVQYAHSRETADPSVTCTPAVNFFGGLYCNGSVESGWVDEAPGCGEEGTWTRCTPLETCTGDACSSRADCRRFCLRPAGGHCSEDCVGPDCRYEYRCCARVSEPATEACH